MSHVSWSNRLLGAPVQLITMHAGLTQHFPIWNRCRHHLSLGEDRFQVDCWGNIHLDRNCAWNFSWPRLWIRGLISKNSLRLRDPPAASNTYFILPTLADINVRCHILFDDIFPGRLDLFYPLLYIFAGVWCTVYAFPLYVVEHSSTSNFPPEQAGFGRFAAVGLSSFLHK